MEWKKLELEGVNKIYYISNTGLIYDEKEKRMRKYAETPDGYYKVSFYIYGKYKRKLVHRLVAQTFNPVDDMDNKQINHIDGDKHNNNIENLEWCSLAENMKHAWTTGLCANSAPTGNKAHHHKLTEEQVKELKEDYYIYHMRIVDITKKYNISRSTFYQIKNGITWKE